MQYIPTATKLVDVKEFRDDGSVVQIVVWQVPSPVPPCTHRFKYRLYYGANGVCRVRYDNERDKGDHRHVDGAETAYSFTSVAQLLADFQHAVEAWEAP